MSSQSLWSDPIFIKFKNFTAKLEKEFENPGTDWDKKLESWHRGLRKIKQLGVSYGMTYDKPLPLFASGDMIKKITWFKFKFEGKEQTYGLWPGADHVIIDKKHVFNQHMLNFFMDGIKNSDKAKAKIFELITVFEGKVSKKEKIL